MTLQVEVSKQNSEQIISAIQLLKGVKSVTPQKGAFKEVVESKADKKAWRKAREDLAKGDVVSHEELKARYGL